MTIDVLKGILLFAVLLLLQVLVFNHIHLFGYATPLLYIYSMMLFRRNFPKWMILVFGFLGGLMIDVFSNTPGLSAASLTLLGLLQPYILILFMPRDSSDDLQPSIKSLGNASFIGYLFVLVFIYCLIFFTLEGFNFFNWIYWIKCVVGSTVITFIFLLAIENLRR
ncbi:MAG: rod shape-determining protein MreD [Prevotella sp.]